MFSPSLFQCIQLHPSFVVELGKSSLALSRGSERFSFFFFLSRAVQHRDFWFTSQVHYESDSELYEDHNRADDRRLTVAYRHILLISLRLLVREISPLRHPQRSDNRYPHLHPSSYDR